MGKMLIILTVAMAGLFSVINLNMLNSNRRMIVNSFADYDRRQAKNIAASGIEMAIMQIKRTITWRGDNIDPIGRGSLIVTASNTASEYPEGKTIAGFRGKYIESIGIVNSQIDTIRAVVEIQSSGGIAAITANNPVETKGNLIVDGREHDINGNLIANSGTLAISTTQTVSVGGSSELAGTYNSSDEGPHDKHDDYSNVIEENAVWPTTPDLFMGGADAGYPEGTLKSIAISGVDGSQYVTDPNNLSLPLSGVTYVELPSGDTWNPVFFGVSSGILVVHNSSTSAIMKNLNDTFTGLIIADDIIHIHCTIIGAVAVLTRYPSEGNCIGNGDGWIKYSSAAIGAAAGGTGVGGGGSSYSVSLSSWYE